MAVETLHLGGKSYVVLERDEYERLTSLAKAGKLPSLPKPDSDGNYPAVEYGRVSMARGIIRRRAEAGLSQRQLADFAGVRIETLCRLEKGKHTPSMATMLRIDRALKLAATSHRKGG
jgi:DNA-binding XRE family transcriptional regulator